MMNLISQNFENYDLEEKDFQVFRELIFKKAGITLSHGKKNLLQTRLRGRVKDLALKDFSSYKNYLVSLPEKDPEWQVFINQLTTNKTNFFREPKHFNFLVREFIPEWVRRNESSLKIWSAASSTGEEAYTLGMIFKNHLPPGKSFDILGTDIDTKVLEKASNGVYRSELLKDIPEPYAGNFTLGTGAVSDWMRINKEVKDHVKFSQFNLTSGHPLEKNFDVIFCRNVLIYFSPSTIESVIEMLYRSTCPGGYLFIGHSESLHTIRHNWKQVAPSIYRKVS